MGGTYGQGAELSEVGRATERVVRGLLGPDDNVSSLSQRGRRRGRITQLMQAGARVDAALELIALQLPRWHLRRIVYDDGDWHCALSQARDMPDWLDGCAEARHRDLPLAILLAAIEAGRIEQRPMGRRAMHAAETDAALLCCDDFS